jgi:hypothetical protein
MKHTRPFSWLLIVLAFGACGRTSSGQNAVATIPLNLPFDPVAGCRDNASTTCTECCLPNVTTAGNDSCSIYRTNSVQSAPGACPSTCPPCGRCSLASEKSLANAAAHARPECDCATIDPGMDPCFTPEGCGCFCAGLTSNLNACPQLGTATCSHGNRCGVVLVADPGPYHVGDQVQALWINFDSRTAFLDSCGEVGLRSPPWRGDTLIPPTPCPTDGVPLALGQGQSVPATLTLATSSMGPAEVFGTYHLGCPNDATVDPSACRAGPILVTQAVLVAP